MDQFDLNSSQRTTLTALVNKYQATESLVSAKALGEELNRKPGTLRNQMQPLKAVGLVKSVPGKNGGYEPTEAAYDALDRQRQSDAETVTLAHDYKRVTATIGEMKFTNVHHPDLCRAQIHFQQSTRDLAEGEAIAVGPSPLSRLAVTGEIVAIDDTENVVIIDVSRMEAPIGDDRTEPARS